MRLTGRYLDFVYILPAFYITFTGSFYPLTSRLDCPYTFAPQKARFVMPKTMQIRAVIFRALFFKEPLNQPNYARFCHIRQVQFIVHSTTFVVLAISC